MIYRTRMAHAGTAVIGAVLGLSAFAAPATAACDIPMDVYIGIPIDAEAHWTECHNGRRTQVTGWVKDDRPDGKCARVRVEFSNGETYLSPKACPAGEIKEFHWNEPAADAQVYLFTSG